LFGIIVCSLFFFFFMDSQPIPEFDIDRVQQLRNELQDTLLASIREFEEVTGCHVEKIDLTQSLRFGYPQRVHSLYCKVVL